MKSTRLLSIVGALAMVAAACSPAADTTTTTAGPDGTQPPPATTTTVAPTGESVEVVWVRGADHPEGEAFIAVLDAFTAATGIEVNYTGLGDDLPTIVGTRVEGGDPPDIAVLPQPGLLRSLAARDALVPASQGVIDGMAANFATVWADLGSVDGTLYGVYFKADNKSIIWYDIDVFDQLGITPPSTWDELITVAGTLIDNGFTPLAVAGADGWTLSDLFEDVYARTAGPALYDQLTNHEIPWTHASVKDALAVIGQLVHIDGVLAGGVEGSLQMGFVDSIVAALGTGDAVMVKGQSAVVGIADEEAGAMVGTDYGFFPFPSIGGSPTAALGGGDVAVALTDNPAAQALLEFLTTPEAVESWAALGGFVSPNQGLALSVYPDEVSRGVAEGLVNAEVFVFDMSDLIGAPLGATTGAGIWGGLQNWLSDPSTVDAVLEQIETEAEAHFSQ